MNHLSHFSLVHLNVYSQSVSFIFTFTLWILTGGIKTMNERVWNHVHNYVQSEG